MQDGTPLPARLQERLWAFFNYVVDESGATTLEYSPRLPLRNRIKLTLAFIHGANEIRAVTLERFEYYKREGWVEDRFLSDEPFQLSHFSFEKLASLLQLLKDLDLASLNQPRIPVVERGTSGIDAELAKRIKALLIQPDGQRIVEEFVRSGLIASHRQHRLSQGAVGAVPAHAR